MIHFGGVLAPGAKMPQSFGELGALWCPRGHTLWLLTRIQYIHLISTIIQFKIQARDINTECLHHTVVINRFIVMEVALPGLIASGNCNKCTNLLVVRLNDCVVVITILTNFVSFFIVVFLLHFSHFRGLLAWLGREVPRVILCT